MGGLHLSEALTHSQHVRVDVGWVHQTGDRLHKDEERDDHQEEAVDEPGENFNPTVAATDRVALSEHPAWK